MMFEVHGEQVTQSSSTSTIGRALRPAMSFGYVGARMTFRVSIIVRLRMLELDDIQYILLTRVPALTGRYEFLSFQQPAPGRAWLEAIREKIPSV